jgi:hypothetical protein
VATEVLAKAFQSDGWEKFHWANFILHMRYAQVLHATGNKYYGIWHVVQVQAWRSFPTYAGMTAGWPTHQKGKNQRSGRRIVQHGPWRGK